MIVQVPDEFGSSFSSLLISCNAYVNLVYPSIPVTFRNRNGLPIKISGEVIAKLEARCRHGIDNILSAAIKPSKIEWLIDGKSESFGAFKVGHSDQAEYLSRDYGECVIYHPPLELTKSPKEIEIRLKLKHTTGDLEYKVYIELQLQKGFGKGLSSLANVMVKSVDQVNMLPIENKKCEICRPELIFDELENQIVLAGPVYDGRYLMTSEYIKMLSSTGKEKEQIWFTSSTGERVLLDGLFPAHDLKWQCSAGKFAGTNTGRSVIYLTPDESGLSKSPVTIAVQADGMTLASRRFWLLRGSSVMHC
ncbi:MAG TPA: hypothetical protein VJ695_10630 [Nitrososphaera sp.]|nr:hypothetical protein [Nitrososphaera sp.]